MKRLEYGFIVFAILYSVLIPVTAYGADGVVWRLKQEHFVSGTQDVYFKKNALKVVNSTLGFVLVAKAPDWNIVAYRRGAAKIYRQSLCKWLASGLTCLYFPDVRPSRMKLVKEFAYKKNGLSIVKFKGFDGRKQIVEYELYTQAGLDPRMGSILQFFYRLPPTDGLPIRFSYFGAQKLDKNDPFYSFQLAPSERLKTLLIEKADSIDFEIPRGYKTVLNDRDVIIGDRIKSGMEDIMRDSNLNNRVRKGRNSKRKAGD